MRCSASVEELTSLSIDTFRCRLPQDFTSDEAGAREFLNRPDFALNSTSPCAYSPEVILTNGVTVDADAIVVGDDLGYSPGYWVLLAFPSMYFFVLLAACVFTAVKAKTDDDNAGVGAACCCCLGLFLPLVVLLPIALDSAVPAADRENLVVAIVVFSLLFAGIPMVCGCLYVTWHAFGNSIKNNAIQEKLGVALGGGVYQEMWKKEFPGFTPQLQSKCETAFEALDEDADGNVQASELINVMKSLGMNPKLPAVNAFLAKADTWVARRRKHPHVLRAPPYTGLAGCSTRRVWRQRRRREGVR